MVWTSVHGKEESLHTWLPTSLLSLLLRSGQQEAMEEGGFSQQLLELLGPLRQPVASYF
jgi:hypothetical protein